LLGVVSLVAGAIQLIFDVDDERAFNDARSQRWPVTECTLQSLVQTQTWACCAPSGVACTAASPGGSLAQSCATNPASCQGWTQKTCGKRTINGKMTNEYTCRGCNQCCNPSSCTPTTTQNCTFPTDMICGACAAYETTWSYSADSQSALTTTATVKTTHTCSPFNTSVPGRSHIYVPHSNLCALPSTGSTPQVTYACVLDTTFSPAKMLLANGTDFGEGSTKNVAPGPMTWSSLPFMSKHPDDQPYSTAAPILLIVGCLGMLCGCIPLYACVQWCWLSQHSTAQHSQEPPETSLATTTPNSFEDAELSRNPPLDPAHKIPEGPLLGRTCGWW